MADPLKTREFGRYELEQLISRGGMGAIFLAHMKGAAGFRKRVVIKKILPHLSQNPDFVTRFIDEANIVVSLTHGNIVPVFDMGEVDGQYFIAMEYIAGRDLRDIINRYDQLGETMPAPLAAFLVSQVCKALAYAHKKTDEQGRPLDIVHRDMSPSNVLVSREGVVKITDFGIAKAVSRLGRSITGRLQGKFAYMSPEQAAGKSVDHRSDVFSVASMAYELFTGQRPFRGETDLAILEEVRQAQPTPLGELAPELPDGIVAAVAKAMAKDPAARYADANKLGRVLVDAIPSEARCHEAEMAEELSRLFPGAEDGLASAATATGLPLDAVMAMEADRMLMGSSSGESPTITAEAELSPVQLGEADTLPAPTPSPIPQRTPAPTPAPLAAAFTPTPRPYGGPTPSDSLTWEPTPVSRLVRWLPAITSVVLLVGVAVALWVYPGYLLTTSLAVECGEPTAQVYVDQEMRGRCGGTFEVGPGTHRVEATLEYFVPATREVSLERGEAHQVALALERQTVEATVRVQPHHALFVIGDRPARPSGTLVEVPAGVPFTVRAWAEGYQEGLVYAQFSDDRREIEMTLDPVVAERGPGDGAGEGGGDDGPAADSGAGPDEGGPDDSAGGELSDATASDTAEDVAGTGEEAPNEDATADRTGPGDDRADEGSQTDERDDTPHYRWVEIDSEPEGATFEYRGRTYTTPDSIRVRNDAGRQQVTVSKDGYVSQPVDFDPADDRRVTARLEPVPVETQSVLVWLPAHPAYAEIYVDGEHVGGSDVRHAVTLGRHVIRCENEALGLWDEVNVEIVRQEGDEAQVVRCWR
jgi:serine/threonine protein kinase